MKLTPIIPAVLLVFSFSASCDAAESAKPDDLRTILLEQRKLDDEIEKLRAEYGKLQKRRQDLEKRISEQLGEKPKK